MNHNISQEIAFLFSGVIMRRIVVYILLAIVNITAGANKWIEDAEPTILEEYYTRTDVYDTTNHTLHFSKEPALLRYDKEEIIYLHDL